MSNFDLEIEPFENLVPQIEAEEEGAGDARRALVRAALSGVNTRNVRDALAKSSTQIIAILTPSPAWSVALTSEIGLVCSSVWSRAVTEKRKDHNSWLNDSVANAVEAGQHIILCLHDLALLPESICAAIDIRLGLPAMTARMVGRAITEVTGQRVLGLKDEMVAGLDFPTLVLALRRGSSARHCKSRLVAAAQRRNGLSEQAPAGPLIEQLPLFGDVALWAVEFLGHLHACSKREMAPAELRHSVLRGPPGTGKTLVAGALARSAGWRFCSASIGEWFTTSDGNLGGVSKACAGFFDQLLAQDCTIGFLDELDSLPSRDKLRAEDLQWWGAFINLMLTQVDRLRASGKRVVLLAATNYPERLDPALVRPGRLENRVVFSLPETEDEIAALFHHYVGGEIGAKDLSRLAPFCHGASPAGIAAWVRQARALARKDGRGLAAQDLMAVVLPPDNRPDAEIEAIALHEAGHALVARLLGIEVDMVSLIANGSAAGVTRAAGLSGFPNQREVENYVAMLMAGRAADEMMGAKGAHAGAQQDLAVATDLLSRANSDWGLFGVLGPQLNKSEALSELIESQLQGAVKRGHQLIGTNRRAILALAKALRRQRVLNGDEIEAILRPHLKAGQLQEKEASVDQVDERLARSGAGEGCRGTLD